MQSTWYKSKHNLFFLVLAAKYLIAYLIYLFAYKSYFVNTFSVIGTFDLRNQWSW